MHTIIGIFDSPRDGQRALAMLRDSRYPLEDISVISKSSEGEITASSGEDVSASGGVAAALIHIGGIPEDEAREYESLVYAGKTLVAVKAQPEDARHVRRILNKADATKVRGEEVAVGGASQRAVQVAMYDEHGRQVAAEPDDTLTNPTSG
jgi:hypothetical protein